MQTTEQRIAAWHIAVVEDHLLQRRQLIDLLRSQPRVRVVAATESLPDLLAVARSMDPRVRPQVVILDLRVDGGRDVEPSDVRILVRAGIRVFVLSELSSPALVRDVMQAGASVVVSKRDSESDVITGLRAALAGRRWLSQEATTAIAGNPNRPSLSDREERALVLYASGHTLDAVADGMGVKPETAKTYLARVREKYAALGRPVRSKLDLNRAALQDGFLELGMVGAGSESGSIGA